MRIIKSILRTKKKKNKFIFDKILSEKTLKLDDYLKKIYTKNIK